MRHASSPMKRVIGTYPLADWQGEHARLVADAAIIGLRQAGGVPV